MVEGYWSCSIDYIRSFEVGYKGVIGDKLSLAVDFYTYERQGFTQFTAIGPAFAYGPDILSPAAIAEAQRCC